MTNAYMQSQFQWSKRDLKLPFLDEKIVEDSQYRRRNWETAEKPSCASYIDACPDTSTLTHLDEIRSSSFV